MNNDNYHKVTSLLNVTILSIFIGIISSIAVNIITSFNFDIFTIAIIALNVLSLYSVFRLILLRQIFDGEFAKRAAINEDPIEKWKKSVAITYKAKFCKFMWLSLLSFLISLTLIYCENQKLRDAKKEDDLQQDTNRKNIQHINRLVKDSVNKEVQIRFLKDSIETLQINLSNKAIVSTKNKTLPR